MNKELLRIRSEQEEVAIELEQVRKELIDTLRQQIANLKAENATLRAGYNAARLEISSLQARGNELGQQLEKEINARQQAQIENERLKERIARGDIKHEKMQLEAKVAGLQAMLTKSNNQAEHFERHWYLRGDEIEGLQARVQELEAMLDAVGAGGVEPLRKSGCLHQIAEPPELSSAPSRWLTTV